MKHLTAAVIILMLGFTTVFAQSYINYTGDRKGWPAAQLAQYGLSNLNQPAGVQSSYKTYGDDDNLYVYMAGANKNTLQEVKQQIEKVIGKKMKSDKKGYSILLPHRQDRRLSLILKGDLLTMQIEIQLLR